jgi:hypothetical protein
VTPTCTVERKLFGSWRRSRAFASLRIATICRVVESYLTSGKEGDFRHPKNAIYDGEQENDSDFQSDGRHEA